MTINFQKSQIDLVSKFVFWSLFEVCILIFDISLITVKLQKYTIDNFGRNLCLQKQISPKGRNDSN